MLFELERPELCFEISCGWALKLEFLSDAADGKGKL